MPVPLIYRKGNPNLISFNFADTADGTGYITYYGAKADNAEYITTINSTLLSEEIATFTQSVTMSETPVKEFDLDFDIVFNNPQNIKGKLYANIPIGATAVSITAAFPWYYAVVIAKHFDGTTETTLATGTSRTIKATIETDGPSFSSMVACCICDISTLKHFRKGDTLRLTVEGWYRINDNADANKVNHILIGHDPTGRDYKKGNRPVSVNAPVDDIELANEEVGGGSVFYTSTQMTFHVPFVIPFT